MVEAAAVTYRGGAGDFLVLGEGAGADTMRRLAAPDIGDLATAFILELLVCLVLFISSRAFVSAPPGATMPPPGGHGSGSRLIMLIAACGGSMVVQLSWSMN